MVPSACGLKETHRDGPWYRVCKESIPTISLRPGGDAAIQADRGSDRETKSQSCRWTARLAQKTFHLPVGLRACASVRSVRTDLYTDSMIRPGIVDGDSDGEILMGDVPASL